MFARVLHVPHLQGVMSYLQLAEATWWGSVDSSTVSLSVTRESRVYT